VNLMIWATVAEVRAHPDVDIPEGVTDEQLQARINQCVRKLIPKILRWPVLDDETDRAADEEQRGHIAAAVAELVRAHYETKRVKDELGGTGAARVIASGGEVAAGKLRVRGGSTGVDLDENSNVLPAAVVDALLCADLIGGGVPSW
jgi:hypothetical protein